MMGSSSIVQKASKIFLALLFVSLAGLTWRVEKVAASKCGCARVNCCESPNGPGECHDELGFNCDALPGVTAADPDYYGKCRNETNGWFIGQYCIDSWPGDKFAWQYWSPGCVSTGTGIDGNCSVAAPSGSATATVYDYTKRGYGESVATYVRTIDIATNNVVGWNVFSAFNVSNADPARWRTGSNNLQMTCGNKYQILSYVHGASGTILPCWGYANQNSCPFTVDSAIVELVQTLNFELTNCSRSCNQTCTVSPSNCATGLTCSSAYGNVCRNAGCLNVANCTCPAQVTGNAATCIYSGITIPNPESTPPKTVGANTTFNGAVPLDNTGSTTWNTSYYLKSFNTGFFLNNPTLINGLIGYWPLRETSGTVVADGAGSHPGAASRSDNATADGRNLDSARSDYVSIPETVDNSSLPPLTAKKMAISLWTKPNFLIGGQSIISRRTVSDVGGYKVETSADNLGRVTCSFYINGDWRSATTNVAMSSNVYNHVVCSYDGATVKAYLMYNDPPNPVVLDQAGFTVSGTINSPLAYTIIGKNINNNTYYSGAIREVGIWERALSDTEIADLFNSGTGANYQVNGPTSTWGAAGSVRFGTGTTTVGTTTTFYPTGMVAPAIGGTYGNFWKLKYGTNWFGPTCGTVTNVACSNTAPGKATNPYPANTTGVSPNVTLSWTAPASWGQACPPNTFTKNYKVYLGPCPTQILTGCNFTGDPPTNACGQTDLAYSTQYCWRVDTYNGYTTTTGDTWQFTTMPRAWFQVTGGDVTANTISDPIPNTYAGPKYIILSD